MKRGILFISMILMAFEVIPQAVVTDPSSMAQRIALFLEEMEETISQSLDIAESSENTLKLFQVTEESINNLKKASSFIKMSRQFVEITDAEIRIAKKLEAYSERVRQISSLSEDEKINIIASMINLGSAAVERIKNGIDIVKNSSSDAKLTDFERLQILSSLEDEILALENAIDETYETSMYEEAMDGVLSTINGMSKRAIMFDL
ncbi:MAG: hypothetical protein MJ009_01155 [Paludibacteraceae bacterium]|nr:hypothetical protein [Paludibacteraceae bacterium]